MDGQPNRVMKQISISIPLKELEADGSNSLLHHLRHATYHASPVTTRLPSVGCGYVGFETKAYAAATCNALSCASSCARKNSPPPASSHLGFLASHTIASSASYAASPLSQPSGSTLWPSSSTGREEGSLLWLQRRRQIRHRWGKRQQQ